MSDPRPGGEPSRGEPLSTGLLSFYDALRFRVADPLAGRGRLGGAATDLLFLVPDVFILLARLSLDRTVPASSRRLLGGALVYFLTPIDLLPEAFLGVGGFADDLVLAAAVVSHAFGRGLAEQAERHWSGRGPVVDMLRLVAASAEELLGGRLWKRVSRLLAGRGVDLSDAP